MSEGPERRLGQRHVIGPVAVRWRLSDQDTEPDEPYSVDDPEPAGLLDLSISGARIMARTDTTIEIGQWKQVSIKGATGPVVVRRILPASIEGFSHYGIEFLDPTSDLSQLVQQELARHATTLADDVANGSNDNSGTLDLGESSSIESTATRDAF